MSAAAGRQSMTMQGEVLGCGPRATPTIVAQVMTRKVHTCRRGDTLHRAARLMWDHDCGAVPIVDERGHTVGMITDRDICMAVYIRDGRCGDPRHGRRFEPPPRRASRRIPRRSPPPHGEASRAPPAGSRPGRKSRRNRLARGPRTQRELHPAIPASASPGTAGGNHGRRVQAASVARACNPRLQKGPRCAPP